MERAPRSGGAVGLHSLIASRRSYSARDSPSSLQMPPRNSSTNTSGARPPSNSVCWIARPSRSADRPLAPRRVGADELACRCTLREQPVDHFDLVLGELRHRFPQRRQPAGLAPGLDPQQPRTIAGVRRQASTPHAVEAVDHRTGALRSRVAKLLVVIAGDPNSGGDEVDLRREVVVHQGGRHAGGLGDVGNGHLGEPHVDDDLHGGLEDLRLALVDVGSQHPAPIVPSDP